MKANAQTSKYAHAHQWTDEKLIPLAVAGHQQACTILVRRYERLVRTVLQRHLSDPEAVKEVAQDTFVRAFRALPGFRGESKLSTWLCKIAVSLAISRLRLRRYAAWESIDGVLSHGHESSVNGDAILEKKETSQMLHQTLRQLSPQDATALELFYFREQSIEEIGHLTGWTSSNVKSRLSRARQRLHSVLVSEGLHMAHYS